MRNRLVKVAVCLASAAALSLVAVPGSAVAAPTDTAHVAKHQHPSGKPKTNQTNVSLRSSAATGVVMTTPRVYLVFWGSQWSTDPAGAASALQNMFGSLYGTADTWGTILDQYCEGLPVGTTTCGTQGTHVQHPTSSLLGGVWFDNATATPTKSTSAQLAAEAVRAAAHFGNTTQAPNLNDQYVIASPTQTHPDGFPKTGFCGWHSSVSSSYGNVAYTNLPYVADLGTGACTTIAGARLIDGYESTETHEYAESITDPFPSTGWLGSGGAEIADLCENLDAYLTTSAGTFDVQGLWSNAAKKCVTSG
jgi:hypothetical protein